MNKGKAHHRPCLIFMCIMCFTRLRQPAPVAEPKATSKPKSKPKKAVKVVYQQSSTDSEDYTDSESSSGSEVIYIQKSKSKKQEKQITKAKAEPPVPKAEPKVAPTCVFKFV